MSVVSVQFRNEGQPVIPDVGSVTYTLYGQDGTALVTDVAVTTGAADTSVRIVVPSQYEQRTLKYEKRTIVVNYTSGGLPLSYRTSYRLTDFLNYTVTPDQIRSYLGLSPSEIADSEIDIVSAYIEVERLVGELALDAALSTGGTSEDRANRAILYMACLFVIPSLRLRLAKERSDGPLTWSRFDIDDFNEIEARLRAELDDILDVLAPSVETSYTLLVVSNPTDPITGG